MNKKNLGKIPFMPIPSQIIMAVTNNFLGVGGVVSKFFPKLEESLVQADFEIQKERYSAIIALGFFIYLILGFLICYLFAMQFQPKNSFIIGILGGFFAGILVAIQIAFYPAIQAKKKIRGIERNLLFGLRTILVEIKSGVTLFDAINLVAQGNNGELSKEFSKAVRKIQTGTYQNVALEEMAENNPSVYFRRAIWQLVNGLKSGGDISTIMQSLVDGLSKEKANQVKKYGNTLKLFSLMYMMLGAIIPALGITFLIILSTFPSMTINETVFWGLFGFLALGQFMFLGMIKSARPSLLGD
jgi:pilus assembly protein TadC